MILFAYLSRNNQKLLYFLQKSRIKLEEVNISTHNSKSTYNSQTGPVMLISGTNGGSYFFQNSIVTEN